MIMCKLNPRVYDSLLVLLDAVRLYRVYRRLDTLPLYIYYELLILYQVLSYQHVECCFKECYARFYGILLSVVIL